MKYDMRPLERILWITLFCTAFLCSAQICMFKGFVRMHLPATINHGIALHHD